MPVIFSNPQFPNQTGPSPFQQPFTAQLNYGEMLRELTGWNPNLDPQEAGRIINNKYRAVVGYCDWYGLKVKGQIGVPNVTATGQVNLTTNSRSVQGIGTAWTPQLLGLQFRPSFTAGYQTIAAVDVAHQVLTLDTNYVGPSTSNGGYQIFEAYVTFGQNVSKLIWAVNQLFGWPMDVDCNIQTLNAVDPWRTALGWATKIAKRGQTPDGQMLCEVWPTPIAQQTFPFEAYTQPPNLDDESDTVLAWIPTDLIVLGGVPDALKYKPKKNPNYDIASALSVARDKQQEFLVRLEQARMKDQGMDQTDVTWDYGNEDGNLAGTGSFFAQAHDV